MNVLDLCSGTGAATIAFRERRHMVVTVDISTKLGVPDVLADVRNLPIKRPPGGWDLVWCSPPCTEFSSSIMGWLPNYGKPPSMEIVQACINAVHDLRPRWWVLENVRGAVPWIKPILGEPMRAGSWMLWGNFPAFDAGNPVKNATKVTRRERNAVAREIADGLCLACERFFEIHTCERRRVEREVIDAIMMM
jgi:hypothetical protein